MLSLIHNIEYHWKIRDWKVKDITWVCGAGVVQVNFVMKPVGETIVYNGMEYQKKMKETKSQFKALSAFAQTGLRTFTSVKICL